MESFVSVFSSVHVLLEVLLPLVVIALLFAIFHRIRRLTTVVYLPEEQFLEALNRQEGALVLKSWRRRLLGSNQLQYVSEFKGQRIACRTERELSFPSDADELTITGSQ